MKRLILAFLLFFSCSTQIYAADPYPQNLYDNPNYKLIYGHMGRAVYMDKSSVVHKYSSKDTGLVFAQYEVIADFKWDSYGNPILHNIKEPHIIWFFWPLNPNRHSYSRVNIDDRDCDLPPWVNDNVAYFSKDDGDHWNPFFINDTHGYNYSLYEGFWSGVQELSRK